MVQGLLQTAPDALLTPSCVHRGWAHECQRVFGDRLVGAGDQDWLGDVLAETIRVKFKVVGDDCIPINVAVKVLACIRTGWATSWRRRSASSSK